MVKRQVLGVVDDVGAAVIKRLFDSRLAVAFAALCRPGHNDGLQCGLRRQNLGQLSG